MLIPTLLINVLVVAFVFTYKSDTCKSQQMTLCDSS